MLTDCLMATKMDSRLAQGAASVRTFGIPGYVIWHAAEEPGFAAEYFDDDQSKLIQRGIDVELGEELPWSTQNRKTEVSSGPPPASTERPPSMYTDEFIYGASRRRGEQLIEQARAAIEEVLVEQKQTRTDIGALRGDQTV